MLDYFFRNIYIALFTEVETYKVFSILNKDWDTISWEEVLQKLTKKSSWHIYRQKLHDKVLSDIVAECNINSSKIEKLVNCRKPTIVLVRGATGAGKTTFINNKFYITSGIVGGDLIRNKLKNAVFITAKKDAQYDLESYFVTDLVLKSLLKQRVSIIIERTIEYLEDLEMLCTLSQKYAYDSVHIIDLDASLENCVHRITERNAKRKGRDSVVPIESVEKCVRNVKAGRFRLIESLKNVNNTNITYELFSNYENGKDFKIIIKISKGKLVCFDPAAYEKISHN